MRTYTEQEMAEAQRRAFLDGCAATAYIVYPSDAADVELLATVTYEQNIDGGHWSDDEVRERAEIAAARRYPMPKGTTTPGPHAGALAMRLTDQQLAEIEARAKRVVDQGIVDDMGDPIAARADVPTLLAEVKELRAESGAHEDTLRDLAETQRALVLLANQLERHQVPFVPEAEQATLVARRAVERDDALIARGMDAARAVFEGRRPTTPAPAVEAR